MANIKYFAECNGQAHQLTRVFHSGNFTRAKDFTGNCPGCGQKHAADRMIEYKQFATKHVCDSRCVNAQGKVMKCECSCGGKNHGRGGVVRTVEVVSA